MHLASDLRLTYIVIPLWLNLFVILKFNTYIFLGILLVCCTVLLTLKHELFLEVLLATLILAGSSLFLYLRLSSLNQTVTNDLISDRAVVKVVATLKSDLLVRNSKNPYSTQKTWEILAESRSINDPNNIWHTSLPIILSFSTEPINLSYGSEVTAIGQITTSYRTDKAFLIKVEEVFIRSKPTLFYSHLNIFRENFSMVAKNVNHSAAGLIPGLVSGDTRLQSEEFTAAMRKTGLTHLTAVSGGNIAILLAVFVWFFKALTFKRRIIFFLSIILLLVFLVLVRFEPSALRATVMGLIGIWSLTFGGPRTSIGALNLSILVLLLVDPFLATNWGFTLSVAATAGLILLSPQIQKLWVAKLPTTPKLLVLLMTMTLSAQLVTYPLIGLMVGEISLISLLANILAMPTVAWVTVFGFLTLITATLLPLVSIVFIYIALPAAIWIETIATTLAKLPFAQVTFSSFIFLTTILLISAIVGFGYRKRIRLKFRAERN